MLVAGAGPAGRAIARSATLRGLRVALVDPAPHEPWWQTFGAWDDELPSAMPADTVAASMPDIAAYARREHPLGRTYCILDAASLHARLSTPSPALTLSDRITAIAHDRDLAEIRLASGASIGADVVIDATGAARAVMRLAAQIPGGPGPRERSAQTAVGVVVDEPAGFGPLFMDWRGDHGEDGWPTFLYGVRVGGGKVLLEETALARRPPLPTTVLLRRLRARLRARDIAAPATAPAEVVDITVDLPAARGEGRVVPFGASAPMIHPATGFSVAASLRTAPRVVAAIADAPPHAAAAAARAVVWSPTARAVHALRSQGLEALLALDPAATVDFFDRFFALPPRHQSAYLSQRDRLGAVTSAMLHLFATAGAPLRGHLVRAGRPGAAAAPSAADGWITVRVAEDADWKVSRDIRLAALTECPDAFWATLAEEGDQPETFWRERLRSPSHATVIACDADGEGVGVMVAGPHHHDPDDAGLYAVWVDPTVRGTDTARRLLEVAVAWARRRGFTRLRLDVGDHNDRAIAFYRRHGFAATGARSAFPPPRAHLTEHEFVLRLDG